MNIIQAGLKKLFTRSTREPMYGNSYSGGLLGSIGGNGFPDTRADFIPLDANGDVLDFKNDSHPAVWQNLQSKRMQFWAYRYCSPLSAVIDRLAEADTNGRIEVINADGSTNRKYAKNPRLNKLMKLLRNPNPFQTWYEFNLQQVALSKIFGYCPVLAVSPFDDKIETKSLWNLNPLICEPVLQDSLNLFSVEAINPIKSWKVCIYNKDYEIDSSDIMVVKDGLVGVDSNSPLPLSKIGGLDYAISNICAAMEADNVLLRKKGPLGIFSHDPKPDMAGWQPLDPADKLDLENDLKRYGLSLNLLQYIVSKTPIRWNPMSFNLRDLMTKETARQGIDNICDRFGFPAELMSGKNATYENRSSAEKFMYQTTVIPFTIRRMAIYDEFFGLEEHRLVLDYDHLPILQEDIMKAGQALQAKNTGLDIAWKAGMITWNEWRQESGMDTTSEGNIYFVEWAKKNGVEINPKNKQKNEKAKTAPENTGAKK